VKPPAVPSADDGLLTAPGLPQPGPPAAGIAHADRAGVVPLAPRLTRAADPGNQSSGAARDTRPPDGRPAAQGTGRPAAGPALVVVSRDPGQDRPAPPAERVLGGAPGPRGRSQHDSPGLAPAVRGPGKARETAQEERDQARACLPLPGPCRIVVLGCTSGAGQTVTALMTARLLASLRAEPVAALDLNPGRGSLARQSRSAPAGTVRDLLGGMGPVAGNGRAAAGIQVIGADEAPESVKGLDDGDFGTISESLSARYRISLIDPGASAVARVLAIADQLVLVAPASEDAPRAVSMTQEWLAAHDHHRLAANTVLVVNGVSDRSMPYVEQAEAIAAGRCRAIVRVPWEDQLGAAGGPYADAVPPRAPARRALTRLAGLIVSGLAGAPGASAPGEPR
jgi:MinD-like ATPase involved in chromosome partitioning or flagellar assembly